MNRPDVEHVLVIGAGRQIATRMRQLTKSRSTTLVRLTSLARVRNAHENERVVALDPAKKSEWIDLARTIHRSDPFTRIAAFTEYEQDVAADIAAEFGLTFHTTSTVKAVSDKFIMRERLREAGVEDVPHLRVTSGDQIRQLFQRHGQLVVKPASGTGSRGVTWVREEGDSSSAYDWASSGEAQSAVVAEGYLDGPGVNVETLSEDGEHQIVAITEKFRDNAHFVEVGHRCPAQLDDSTASAIREHVALVLTALGVRNGPSCTEVCITDEGIRTVETHLRPGGDSIPELIRDATGIDLFDYVARQAAGDKVLPEIRRLLAIPTDRVSAIWFAPATAAGIIKDIKGLDDARAIDEVQDVTAFRSIGDAVGGPELIEHSAKVVACRAVHTSHEEALAIAQDAVSRITFVIGAP